MSDGPGEATNPPIAPGQEQLAKLSLAKNSNGTPAFSDQDLAQYRTDQSTKLSKAGFAPADIDKYWGNAPPVTGALGAQIARGQQTAGVTEAHGIVGSLAAGFGMSDTGLAIDAATGKKVSQIAPTHPSWTEAVAAGAGQAIGDAPATIAGFFGGAAAGSAAGATVVGAAGAVATAPVGGEGVVAAAPGAVAGGVVGAGFGSTALPQAIREGFLDAQNAGDIKSASDFWHVVGVSTLNTLKAGAVGSVTNIVGGAVGGKVIAATGSKVAGAVMGDAAATGAGVVAGAAMEGHLPSKTDFIAAGATVLMQHGLTHVGAKVNGSFRPSSETARVQENLEQLYRRTGIRPFDAVAEARRDPGFAAELLQQDVNGDSVTPRFNATAPHEPAPYTPPSEAATPPEEAIFSQKPAARMKDVPEPAAHIVALKETIRGLETGGRADPDAAVSAQGAIGAHQIMVGTARQYGFGEGMSDQQLVSWLHDPHNNDSAATKILTDLSTRFRGDTNATLVAYNAGPRVAGRYLTAGPGTALEAVKDASVRGGIAYHTMPAQRDESQLPLETQRYLAKARLASGTHGAYPEQAAGPTPVDLTTLHTKSGASYQVNSRFASNFQGFVNDLEAQGYHIKSIGGFSDRNVAGTTRSSYHAQGAAIDINPDQNPVGHGDLGQHDLPANIQQLAEKHGLGWGGAWHGSKKDPMHFSIAAEEGGTVALSRGHLTVKGGGGGGEPPGGEGGGLPVPDDKTPVPYNDGKGGGGEPPEPPEGLDDDAAKKWWGGINEDGLVDEIMRGVGEPDKAPSLWNADRFMSQWVSELTPARNVDTALIDGSNGAFVRDRDLGIEDQFRQTYGSDMRAGYFGRFGVLDPITQTRVRDSSLLKATQQVRENGGDVRGWEAYMIAGRAAHRAEGGQETGFNEHAAGALFGKRTAKSKYDAATKTFRDMMTGGLEYARDSGMFSDAQVKGIVASDPTFVSFRRIMGDDSPTAGGSSRGFRVRSPVAAYEGSQRQITSPIAATLDNLRLTIKMADRNRAIGSVIGAVEAGKLDNLGFEKLEFRPNETLAAGGSDVFKPYGLEQGEGQGDPKDSYGPLLAERAQKANDPNTFIYYRDGNPELWKTKDPMLAALLRKPATAGEADIVSALFNRVAAVERAGIVTTPDFPTRVTLRHQFTAFIADPMHPPPIFTWMSGLMDVLGQSDVYKDWIAKGGAGTALADMDMDYIHRDMHQIFSETGLYDRVANAVQHPLEFFQLISEKIDAAARVGYYKGAVAKGVDPIKAATMSRKAMLDYAERSTSAIANGIAQKVPFWRPRVLGAKQWGEAWTEHPIGTAAYSLAAITLPGIALYGANYMADQSLPDGQKYRDLPRWERDNYYVTPPIAGVRLKLQLPPYMGFAFKAVPERIFDALAQHDPHAFDGFIRGFMNEYLPEVMPSSLPTLIQTPLEVATNNNFFTGKPLVPASVEKADGYMQYTNMTTEPAKAVARFLGPPGINVANLSPIQLEAFVNGWTGPLGMGVLRAVNAHMTDYHPPAEAANIPFVSAFVVRNPGMGAQPIQNFYEDMDRMEAAHSDWSLAMKHNNPAELKDAANGPFYGLQILSGIRKTISVQAAAINGINEDKSMRPAEKAQAVEQVYASMIQLCERGSDLANQIEHGHGKNSLDLK